MSIKKEYFCWGEEMFEKALVIEIAIAAVLFIVYKLFSYMNSEKRIIEKKQLKMKLEQEKQEKRELAIQESIQKNINKFSEFAALAFSKRESTIMDYLSKIDLTKNLTYDFETLELTFEEQKAFYEEHIEKLRKIKMDLAPYISFLPLSLMKLYKWYSFSADYSNFMMEQFKDRGFDIIQNVQKIYKDITNFQNEFQKTTEEIEKKYHILCISEERRKKLNKELDRLKEGTIRFTGVKFPIDENLSITFDNVVITKNGIFCLKIKYLDKANIDKVFISNDESWTGEMFNGELFHIEPIEAQFFKNIQLFQKLINDKLKEKYSNEAPYLTVSPLIIITEEEVAIENESDVPIKKLGDIFNHIQLYKGTSIQTELLADIKEILATIDIGQKTEKINDNIKTLQQSAEFLYNVLKTSDLINECIVDYCISIEDSKIIKAYKQYMAYEYLLKYKKSVEDANWAYSINRQDSSRKFMVQDPYQPLIDRLVEPCITVPVKILAEILDLSLLKVEFILKDIYNIDNLKNLTAAAYQYINRGIVEIISVHIPEDILKTHMEIEVSNNVKLYKLRDFELN